MLVNVTERNVFSFRVLNNPLNSIPALQSQSMRRSKRSLNPDRQLNVTEISRHTVLTAAETEMLEEKQAEICKGLVRMSFSG